MTTSPSWPESWQTLGAVAPESLAGPRLQLHRAARVAAAVGRTLLTPEADFSHEAFSWFPGMRAMAQRPVEEASQPFHTALRPEDLELIMLSEDNVRLAELPLSGRTVGQIYHWLEDEVQGLLGRPLPKELEGPGEIAGETIGDQDRFSRQPPAAFAELARYFANAHRLIEHRVASQAGAGPILVWPHHFDIACKITVEEAEDGKEARTVGAGLMPGEGPEGEPYFYVSLWPHDGVDTSDLPELPSGAHWNTEKWIGGKLPLKTLVESSDAAEQARRADEFVVASLEACRKLLDAAAS
jgi:hypothetical protein